MNPKYKVIALITVAALTMAALIYVNLQNVRDTGRSSGPARTAGMGF